MDHHSHTLPPELPPVTGWRCGLGVRYLKGGVRSLQAYGRELETTALQLKHFLIETLAVSYIMVTSSGTILPIEFSVSRFRKYLFRE